MAEDLLREYRRKRDPEQTPEPFGVPAPRGAPSDGAAGAFVVQQHAARRMHWDLRLEIAGVLVSWAVPRGPSPDPKEKRLAVQTEDHPLEYADFEGLIPAGNYGAGAMIVWDRGAYRTVDGTTAAAALARGKLDLDMQGHKLRGRWALVRTKGEGGRNWLLIKKADGQPTTPELVVAYPGSVLSGLTVDELQRGVQRTAELAERAKAAGAPRRTLDAATLSPMLAETEAEAFSKAGWIFELKYDGVRVLAGREPGGEPRLYYRTGRDTTLTFPEIARALARLPCDQFLLDGEIVTFDERGATSFERLQKRLGLTDAAAVARAETEVPVVMVCFDLLAVAGHDLRRVPLHTRKDILRALLPERGVLRFAEHVDSQGEAFFGAVDELGLEGIVAKRADSFYANGRRTRDWLKIKLRRSTDVAIVGFTRGRGTRQALGALMVAWCQDGELVYAGNVGTGLDAHAIDELLPRLEAARRDTPAFRGTPAGPVRAQVFVEPRLVAEVRYTEITSGGLLRQPVFMRWRDDKSVAQCAAPAPRSSDVEIAAVAAPASVPAVPRFTNLDKVFWPQEGYTKGDLLHYYEAVWPLLAPYLRDRPVVLTRYPDGIDGKSFFQKNAPDFTPDWVETVRIEDTDYFMCNTLETLLYVINLGCIPVHVWSARHAALERPDWAILDLDPKGAPFAHVVAVARDIRKLLEALDVPHFVKTSGQEGLHVLVPLGASLTHTEARTFAELLARVVVADRADIATVARPLGQRGGKVYVDFLQNGFGKTIAAPFSVRPRSGAPVSTPLTWAEVGARLDPARFTIRTVPARFARRTDPMRGVLETTADVHSALALLAKHLS